jgi:hypothetical protein
MVAKTFKVTLVRDDSACFIPVPFDPKAIFGKVRVPVRVTLNGYTYRSTIASMGGQVCIPLRKSNREAAALQGNETLDITLELDEDERAVEIPEDLSRALTGDDRKNWSKLSYTRRKQHAEAIMTAKQAATRHRRVQRALEDIRSVK